MLNKQKTAIALAIFSAIVHLMWVIFVALGWAGPLMKWVMSLHFVSEPVTVTPFSLGTAVVLIVVASFVAYIVGFVFATIWNSVRK